jgi:fumarate hydratase subunit beta
MDKIKEQIIETPVDKKIIKNLNIGDVIRISGIIFTLRDKAHQKAIELYKKKKKLPVDINNGVIFHCGPIARKTGKGWQIISGGPTTSMRMEKYEGVFIRYFNVSVIIGKGGMGESTAQACKEKGTVYCTFTGGAGALAAKSIKSVENVFWLDELGMPEALWVLKVENFGPLIVTIDAKGRNFTKMVKEEAKKRISQLL